MKNYVFFSPFGKQWVELTKKLKYQNIAVPILWICDDKNYLDAKEIFGDNVVKSMFGFVHYPHKLENINYGGIYCDFLTSKNYLIAKDRCLKMLDRLDIYGLFSRKDKEIYFHNIIFWTLKHFSKNKPDFLLTVEAPHSHAQYVIYEICNFFKIPVLRFNQWAIAPCIYLRRMDLDKLIEYGNLNKKVKEKIINTIENSCRDIINSREKEYLPVYMNRQKSMSKLNHNFSNLLKTSIYNFKSQIKNDIKLLLVNISFLLLGNSEEKRQRFFKKFIKAGIYHKNEIYKWYYDSKYDPINPYGFLHIFRFFIFEKRRNNIIKAINSLPNYIKPKEKFVFFPLMFEHERTTNPDGGIFHDQIIALSNLRRFIPENIKIIVKEHPSQYYNSLRGKQSHRGPGGRSPIYKNVIKNIKNTEFIGIKDNTTKILNDCLFVATITGSIAFEAALLEKKSIVFGETWYEEAPNIFKWNLDLNFYDFIESKTYAPKEVIDYFKNKAVKTCALGTQAPSKNINYIDAIKAIDDYSEESIKSIYELLKKAIDEI